VAASIQEFGFRQPIVVDKDGVIIVGHTRWKAAKKLELARVPVHVATDLTDAQIKAYRIADNQSNTLADWNYELLPIELRELRGLDFNMELLGFKEGELGRLLEMDITAGLTDADSVPEPGDAAITQKGDVWVLGSHRLMCGDSGLEADVDRLLNGERIHLVNTDPPYNVQVAPRSQNARATAEASGKYTGQQGMDAAITRGGKRKIGQGKIDHALWSLTKSNKAHKTTDKMRLKDRPIFGLYSQGGDAPQAVKLRIELPFQVVTNVKLYRDIILNLLFLYCAIYLALKNDKPIILKAVRLLPHSFFGYPDRYRGSFHNRPAQSWCDFTKNAAVYSVKNVKIKPKIKISQTSRFFHKCFHSNALLR